MFIENFASKKAIRYREFCVVIIHFTKQNGAYFANDIFKSFSFFNIDGFLFFLISLKFVLRDPMNNASALIQIMA